MKTLWDMPRGQTAEIAAITQTLPQQIQQRLFEMGFEPGRALTCVQRGPFSGPVVVAVADCVYSLEQAIAREIHIRSS